MLGQVEAAGQELMLALSYSEKRLQYSKEYISL
jgi:hypothetical protein